ncbi:MAG: Holliday junction branch migration protein RuvA [Beggiatoa sp. IS2]|nr:MAG: Holliday junction branch migration protein RuvA [Beggiatoa sp. IS2]
MINRLRGILLEKHPPSLVIDVQGVGYEVEAPMSTFYHLPALNTEVSLLTHLSIREDAHILYGFISEAERQWFRLLIRINGIGPKLALGILSAMELQTFAHCIHHRDIARLTRIPGVGKKTAERLIVETSDHLHNLPITQLSPLSQQVITSAVDDAISALIALGYKPQEAKQWVHTMAEEGDSSETLIRRALQMAVGHQL